MKPSFSLATFIGSLLLIFVFSCAYEAPREKRILVFSKTEGYRHASIEAGIAALKQLGRDYDFTVITTEDASKIEEDFLKTLSAVVFLNTTGDVLDHIQQADFERFIQAGGGFVGVHAAADTEYNWPWYGRLVGGYFKSHPATQQAKVNRNVVHSTTEMLPEVWERTDEWYNYYNIQTDLEVLLKLDENSYEGGAHEGDHPIAWYHDYDGGRAFYTGLGHTEESYSEELFLQHLQKGIDYAIGENKLDYSIVSTYQVPEENRFVRSILATHLHEPMELDILPNGDILFVERTGRLKKFKPGPDHLMTVTKMNVHNEHEDGLLGLAVDPNYEENHWIYLFYSPVGEEPVQHVSRFVFWEDSLHYASEKVVIKIPVQRDECCHSGGSLEFGPDGNLFIGIGDNTNPFGSNGYAPIDERPGREPWDGQRGPGNTNDLRGKILRITPQPDGSYTIPDGNLFPVGTPKTKPEIYVMGCRNPFRISIDERTGYLYWGDVGPDAGENGELRGPKGLDEFNQAQKPGFWGWPYTRGNNQAYYDYNFTTKQSGEPFDPQNLINDSPNNTGMRQLPPVQKSVVWYSYDRSEEFPWVKKGGKNPMAGPIYYSDKYTSKKRLPPYFDGKLIGYEWMRHWMYIISIDSSGTFVQADPFLPNMEFFRPMDMIIGHDGAIYMLEYGIKWFAQNPEARLSRIEYNRDNRPPVAQLIANKTAGAAPFTVTLSAKSSVDYDDDPLTYSWKINGESIDENSASISRTFELAGDFEVEVRVRDKKGLSSSATTLINVGNDPPKIDLEIAGNQTFYWENRQLNYKVHVSDKEDGQSGGATFDESRVNISFDQMSEAFDLTEIAQGHLAAMQNSLMAPGAFLIEQSDCKGCHAIDKRISGPSYLEIAQRYKTDPKAIDFLADKIITGGAGNWGQTAMAAHPDFNKEQTIAIAEYILSLADEPKEQKRYPLEGVFVTHTEAGKNPGRYLVSVSYTDKGNGGIAPPLTDQQMIILHPLQLAATRCDHTTEGLGTARVKGNTVLGGVRDGDYFAFDQLDLSGVSAIKLGFFANEVAGGRVELHLDTHNGPLIAQASLEDLVEEESGEVILAFEALEDKQDIYFVFKNDEATGRTMGNPDWVYFQMNDLLTMK